MSYKSVSNVRATTVTLDGGVCTVAFKRSYMYYAVRNDSNATIYISTVNKECTPEEDGVVSVPAGASYVYYNGFGGNNEIYLSGTGSVVITAQDNSNCPYISTPAATSSGGSSDSGLNGDSGMTEEDMNNLFK